jgi:hypothetical protein
MSHIYPRYTGEDRCPVQRPHWIPAFAGMTTELCGQFDMRI